MNFNHDSTERVFQKTGAENQTERNFVERGFWKRSLSANRIGLLQRRFVCPVFEARRKAGQSKRRDFQTRLRSVSVRDSLRLRIRRFQNFFPAVVKRRFIGLVLYRMVFGNLHQTGRHGAMLAGFPFLQQNAVLAIHFGGALLFEDALENPALEHGGDAQVNAKWPDDLINAQTD